MIGSGGHLVDAAQSLRLVPRLPAGLRGHVSQSAFSGARMLLVAAGAVRSVWSAPVRVRRRRAARHGVVHRDGLLEG